MATGRAVEGNGVRGAREALGLSQGELARAASLSRQSIGAIESGKSTPSVDVALRLASILGRKVEELFGAARPNPPPSLKAEAVDPAHRGRSAVAKVGGRWVAWPLVEDGARQAADALSLGGKLQLLKPESDLERNVVLTGCALGMGILADRLNARSGPGRFLWFPRSNRDALRALETRRTHVAGLHAPEASRTAAPSGTWRVSLGRWEAGLVVRRGREGAARGVVRTLADLANPKVRLVAREEGAGVQRLLEALLRRERLPLSIARSPHLVARGHLDVARAVAIGAGDAGVATRDAALAFGLDFVALAEERVDLVLPKRAEDDPRLARMLDVLASAELRRELEAAGYDTRGTGARAGSEEEA